MTQVALLLYHSQLRSFQQVYDLEIQGKASMEDYKRLSSALPVFGRTPTEMRDMVIFPQCNGQIFLTSAFQVGMLILNRFHFTAFVLQKPMLGNGQWNSHVVLLDSYLPQDTSALVQNLKPRVEWYCQHLWIFTLTSWLQVIFPHVS